MQLNDMTHTIIYEQPLNEVIRVCLRLEQLFELIDYQMQYSDQLSTRQLIHYLIDVLQLLDRPDLKAKLAKELLQTLSNLQRYHNAPDADLDKLQAIARQLEEHAQHLINSSGKIGYRLRDIEMLNTLRLHLANPGGGCNFDLPLYHYWLEQPVHVRQEIIQSWLMELSEIRSAITLLLTLVRSNAKTVEKTAIHGFLQELLDPQANYRMIRIGIHDKIAAFPEISVGRHFLSIRFYVPDIEKRPVQYPENILFWMAYCHS